MDVEIYGTDLKLIAEIRPEYTGIGVDLLVNRKGDIELARGRENLGQSIMHRLMTRKGELAGLGHPEYGSRLHELIGMPNNEPARDLVRLYAKECIMQEPRVKDILSIEAFANLDDPGAITLNITILPIKSNIPLNLVIPFLLEVA
jgi:phage baseplate assembly protein W